MPTFQPFGPDHWAVLAFVGVASLVMIANASRVRRLHDDRVVRGGLALVLAGNLLGSLAYLAAHGRWRLPFQLCDLAVLMMAWALLGSRRSVSELAFFWGLAGSLQAVLTPDLAVGFPSATWLTFFVNHCGTVLGAVYLAVRGRVQPTAGSVWRVWLITNLYVGVAGLLNRRLGTNFGYLASKPAHPSLLDALGPWPNYIVGMELIGLVSFFLCLGVSRMIDRVAAAQVMKETQHA